MADLFISGGEVMWDGDDIAIVDEGDDIRQQAYLRCATDEGESMYHPSYGSQIFMYLGKAYNKDNKGYVEQAASDALKKVDGIEEVLSVSFKEIVRQTADGVQSDFYIYSEYKVDDGSIITGGFGINSGV